MSEDRDRYLIGLIEGRSSEGEILGALARRPDVRARLRAGQTGGLAPGVANPDYPTAVVPPRSGQPAQSRDTPSSEEGRSGYTPDLRAQLIYLLQTVLDVQNGTMQMLQKMQNQSYALMSHSLQQDCEDCVAALMVSAEYATQIGAYPQLAAYYLSAREAIGALSSAGTEGFAKIAAGTVNTLVLATRKYIQIAEQQVRRRAAPAKKPGLLRRLFGR